LGQVAALISLITIFASVEKPIWIFECHRNIDESYFLTKAELVGLFKFDTSCCTVA